MNLKDVKQIFLSKCHIDNPIPLWIHIKDDNWELAESISYINQFFYLHSENKPEFNPEVLTSDQLTTNENLWYFEDNDWLPVVAMNPYLFMYHKYHVYLYSKDKPKRHPLQTRIVNLLLRK